MRIPQFSVKINYETTMPQLAKVIGSGYIGQGPVVEEFESELMKVLDYDYGVTVNSATSALALALHLAGVGPGDDVVTTPMTCSATNSSIAHTGANIVWADVDRWGNLDPSSVYYRVTPNTKAVMAVDWGGLPCDYDNLRSAIEHAPRRGHQTVPIIEDAAHSILATYKDKTINRSGGDYIAYSFQAIKHLTTGDGGLLVVPSYDYEDAKLLRWYGFDRTTSNAMRCRQDLELLGWKYHMNDINASIGLTNLPYLEETVKQHRANSQMLDAALIPTNLPPWPTNRTSSFWLYTIHVQNPIDFEQFMAARDIGASQTHSRNDQFSVFAPFKDKTYPLKELDKFFSTMCCIPVGWWLSESDIGEIIDSVLEYNKRGLPEY